MKFNGFVKMVFYCNLCAGYASRLEAEFVFDSEGMH